MLVFSTPTPTMPCSWEVDTSCCADWNTYDAATQQSAAEYGALIMWAATGRRYGLCERTVRPCGKQCRDCLYAGYFWSEGTWIPYILNGVWRNCGACGAAWGCCSCAPTCEVWLDGPVASIPATGVSVDGEIIPADAWRVDDGQWLVRTDGDCWPECQDYDVDSGTGLFTVTYFRGVAAPAPVLSAAGELACEWAKACAGAACRLPGRVSSIARQGVSVSMVDVADLLDKGLTGIFTVDQVIRSINPYGLMSRMKISSPDLPVIRTTTYP